MRWLWLVSCGFGCAGAVKAPATTTDTDTDTDTDSDSDSDADSDTDSDTDTDTDTDTDSDTDSATDTGTCRVETSTWAEFYEELLTRYTLEWKACTGDPLPTVGTTDTGGCVFDQVAAEACLCDPWTCNTDVPGSYYVVPAAACADACGGSVTTGGTGP